MSVPPPPPIAPGVPPPPPGGILQASDSKEGKRKSWAVTKDISEQVYFKLGGQKCVADLSTAYLSKLWSKMDGIRIVEDAAVVFLKMGDSGVLVFKASVDLAQEEYGTRVAKLLQIRSSGMRLVFQSDDEIVDVRKAMATVAGTQFDDKFLQKGKLRSVTSGGNTSLWMQLSKLLRQTAYMLSEFVPGRGLDNIADDELTPELLESIGSLLAFDSIINNVDRLPVIADNEGNPGNVHISEGRVVAIDNRAAPVRAASGIRTRVEKVKELVEGVRDAGADSKGILKLQDFISKNALPKAGTKSGWADEKTAKARRQALVRGFTKTGARAAKLSIADFRKIHKGVVGLPGENPTDAWKMQCSAFNDDFVAECAAQFKLLGG